MTYDRVCRHGRSILQGSICPECSDNPHRGAAVATLREPPHGSFGDVVLRALQLGGFLPEQGTLSDARPYDAAQVGRYLGEEFARRGPPGAPASIEARLQRVENIAVMLASFAVTPDDHLKPVVREVLRKLVEGMAL